MTAGRVDDSGFMTARVRGGRSDVICARLLFFFASEECVLFFFDERGRALFPGSVRREIYRARDVG